MKGEIPKAQYVFISLVIPINNEPSPSTEMFSKLSHYIQGRKHVKAIPMKGKIPKAQ